MPFRRLDGRRLESRGSMGEVGDRDPAAATAAERRADSSSAHRDSRAALSFRAAAFSERSRNRRARSV